MDYLDPKKEFRHHVILMVGYVLIAIAIVISTLVLVYQAYGFGVDRNGEVVQNGLTFFSSHPSSANIYVNDKLKANTNTRMVLPSGVYKIKLTRDGYFDWQRSIEVEGGGVKHYDYPFLFPKSLSNTKFDTFASVPGLVTQSPDHRWMMVQKPGSVKDFFVYDLKNPEKDVVSITLPQAILTEGNSNESWVLGEWADDNEHVLLQHIYDAKTEYILANRTEPDQSVNLNKTLSLGSQKLTLNDKKYDKYYLYDSAGASLSSATLKNTESLPVLQHVLAFKSYGSKTVLYVTDNGAPEGKVRVRMTDGSKTWTIRNLPAGTNYVVDFTKYDGDLYVAAGAASDNRVFVYKDPAGQIDGPNKVAVPSQVLRVENVNHLSFSSSAQFILAQSGNRFGVYDIQNEKGYNYSTVEPIDAPQTNASWMDGNRLTYVSGGKTLVFDYDYLNKHQLSAASSNYLPVFSPDYKYVYTFAPSASGQVELIRTALLAKDDL